MSVPRFSSPLNLPDATAATLSAVKPLFMVQTHEQCTLNHTVSLLIHGSYFICIKQDHTLLSLGSVIYCNLHPNLFHTKADCSIVSKENLSLLFIPPLGPLGNGVCNQSESSSWVLAFFERNLVSSVSSLNNAPSYSEICHESFSGLLACSAQPPPGLSS